MKTDEFAFLNQQLAGMLRSGIPLEDGLRQLAATLQNGSLKEEFTQLEADLAQGVPLKEALAARRLPPLYIQMVQVGARSNDLPGVLTMLADYYGRVHALGARLKGLAIYPAILLAASLVISVGLAVICSSLIGVMEIAPRATPPALQQSVAALWLAPGLLIGLSASLLGALAFPRTREKLRWRLPGFKEARLSQVASALSLLLKKGVPLNDALAFMRELEAKSEAREELSRWQSRLAEGHARISEVAGNGRFFPPLFVWLVASAGEDLAAGFDRAADLYHARACHRVELMLYAFLPVSILTLGLLILAQIAPVANALHGIGNSLDFVM